MKKTTLVITIMMLIISMGCKKAADVQKTTEKTISVSLNKSDTLYNCSFGYFGDEESISIIKQAKHSSISEIKNQHWEERIFQYQPKNNFIGLDTVIIETRKGTDGGAKPNLINNTIFIFRMNH